MKNLIKSLLTITALIFILSSCEKDEVDPVDPIVCDIHITDDITENTTWKASCTYYVDQSINIKNDAILTIEPGTVIKFAPGKQLDIADYSTESGNIIAEGTKDKPILFTSQAQVPAKGNWNSIWLYSGSTSSKFKYCKIEYAGGSNSTDHGAISTNSDARVAIDYCTFANSGSYGVCDRNHNQGVFTSFTNNTFIDNSINDISINAFNVSSIGEGNNFSKDIDVTGTSVDAPGDVVWGSQNANYNLINSNVIVGGPTGTKLIIEAGASIRFSQGGGIEVAYASTRFGMIEAIGTAAEPITFTSSNSNPSKGDWKKIIFYDGSSMGSIFDHCNFSYGGAGNGGGTATAMIVFKYQQGPTTTIQNCSFENSEGYGIMLDQVAIDMNYPTLSNNTFSNNTLGDKNW